MIYLSSLLVTFILSYATITWLIMPVLTRYQSLARLINHFDYTALTLILLLTLIIWLFGIQYHLKHFSVIYLYLAFSVYLLLLFMVLFTKTTDYVHIRSSSQSLENTYTSFYRSLRSSHLSNLLYENFQNLQCYGG